ncbi:hypothetical protein [Lysinibacillus sp. SGAir0095]|uniref:hypothetical protein n=1 Tax=Lysinibacillus sp. SGAir0095 TaxID=2070463 RepID=UPI0010CCCDE5|nr:hypothetical protein [Lysinibacillus sp. SGAir0095]QCR32267.1 hypothetical protein C1N55_08805 [Lysinibacillus sp. SGAir0095]
MNKRFIIHIVTAVLFIFLVFMNFIGYWNANNIVQVIFFFAMVFTIFNVGIEFGRNKKMEQYRK